MTTANEVGRSSFNYALVRSAFEQALQILKGVFIRDRRCGGDWRRFYKGSMMSLIMPFTQEQLQYRNWLKSFVLEYKEPEQPPSTVVCNTLLAPSIDLAKCALQQYIMSLPRSSRPLEIVDPRDLERMSTTTTASPSHDNGSELTCTSSSASDAAGPVVNTPMDEIDRSTTASEKSDLSEVAVDKDQHSNNGDSEHAAEDVTPASEASKSNEKPTTLAAIVAGTTSRSKSKQLIDDLDKKNGNNYQIVYYKRNGERGPATRRDSTPRLTSDDGGESSERDSVKNDGYQTVRSRNRPRHK
ncbi:unnamed protein product [Heligmosomoides polygyrus]|uniref:Uncharacterized protein n=1 Tax=Heligmosomoides polygyrus TaxID=6339 RepID=A0A183FG72_HELPZ|nr:unnamed protein product [Heligmosomoides polygyrus]